MKIAVTGGVASGKTSVCDAFQQLGAFIVSADAIAHELLVREPHLRQQILQRFGSEGLRNGSIDRTFLAKKVFQDPEQLDWLEKLLHPAVLQQIKELYTQVDRSRYSSFVAEVPLLFEAGWASFFDRIITVTADPTLSRARFENRGGTEYDKRMKRQLPVEQKEILSHYTIQNNGSLEELYTKSKTLYQKILTEGKKIP